MATPQSTTSYQGADAGEDKKLEQITFRFCSECSNMLYPKEDEESHKLQFTCRTCKYTEEAQSTCVFRNILNNSAGETAGVTQDVGSDPTVSDALMLPVCLHCGMVITCNTCGSPNPDMLVMRNPTTIASSCCGRMDNNESDSAKDHDAFLAMASNIGWTDEDLFDEFGDNFDFDDGFFANHADSDSTMSDDTLPETPSN
ncbi:hypothetical protein NQ176_g5784 [Zarea fungicola]|uniref:Uncharacterized protein n=1 Tax=Zarea fungicola TaxID=93591 RepID=A0ACC1N7S6_9HYPO|nr:hypothetical protein NQ176_g5784 [Lecanicillium fungicola]